MTQEELKQLLNQQPLVGSKAAELITDDIIDQANKFGDKRKMLERQVLDLQKPVDDQAAILKQQIHDLYVQFNNQPHIKALSDEIVGLQTAEDKTRAEVIKYHQTASYPYKFHKHPLASYVEVWEEKVKNALRELYPNTNFDKLWSHCEDYAEPDRDTWDNEEIDGSKFINQVYMFMSIHSCLDQEETDEDRSTT